MQEYNSYHILALIRLCFSYAVPARELLLSRYSIQTMLCNVIGDEDSTCLVAIHVLTNLGTEQICVEVK